MPDLEPDELSQWLGLADEAHAITTALFDASRADHLYRLPELFCGFPREGASDPAPVSYPVSCRPQAWAAGTMPLLLRAMLGLSVDLAGERLVVTPALPAWLERVTIHRLHALGRQYSLTVRRVGDDYAIDADGDVARGRPKFVETALTS